MQGIGGRRILVTGASSGLGKHFAADLAARGAVVALGARRTDRLDAAVASIEEGGGRAVAVAMDVEDETSVIGAFDRAQAAIGPIDAVVANAGISSRGMAADIAISEFDRVLDVNLRGAFLTAREAARRMMAAGSRETGSGRIVLISSIGGLKPLPGVAAYCASKAGLVMLGKSLAREWINRGINVNVVCPGYVETELTGEFFAKPGGQKLLASFPRRRLLKEEDVGEAVAYLLSDASRSVTGSVLTIDDGQSL